MARLGATVGSGAVRVELVGPCAVRRGDVVIAGLDLGGRRARVALTALALIDGPVPADRLAALIWPDALPPTWAAALRGVIRSLRTTLDTIGAGGQQLIVTTPSGYRLAAGTEVDLDLAEHALAEAAALAGQGRYGAALASAEPVTRLSGEALLPDEDGPWLAPHRARTDALALRALELVAESATALGDHHRAIAASRRAVLASPLDERAHRALFGALRGAGDRAGVVRAYEDCRAVLAEQLGVDPSQETIDAYLAAIGSAAVEPGAARVPRPASTFIGRSAESAALAAAILRPGLVTIAGHGGVGKTRLATHIAGTAATSAALNGGRLWVSLGTVDADELVAAQAAMELGLPVGTDDAAVRIAERLAPLGRTLLVFDGCEAVLDGVASLTAGLLAACPALTLVATSRVPLGIDGERVIELAAFPPPLAEGWRQLANTDQVRLLADRVHAQGGELTVDEATGPFVAELCRRCGGLPLAIELAGAQLAAMSVPDLLDHLPTVIADGTDRVRAIARSGYELLDGDEATVFRRLAVLDGPHPLPFLRDVVAGGPIAPVRVVRILRELTARGLLTVDRSGPRWLYQQDDDLHRMARELLDAAGETSDLMSRLADVVAALLPAAAKTPPGPYLESIGQATAAVRTVLDAAINGTLALDRGLDIAFRLHRYWAATNVAEGRFWLSRLLADAPPGQATGYATYGLGYLGYWAGDTAAAARELHSAAEQLAGAPDEYAARALIYLGGLADDTDRGEEALGYVRRSIAAARPFSPDLQVGAAIGMGCVLAERASPDAARFAADAIALCRRSGSAEQLAATLPTAAMVCWQVGALAAAREYVAEAMPLLAGSRRIAHVVLLSAAAGIALADGDLADAVELGRRADADARELGIDREIPLIRCVLARALLASGDVAGAAGTATAAITAAGALAYSHPLALCLETAALILLADPADPADPRSAEASQLLGAARDLRSRGDRPGPVPLAGATARAWATAGAPTGSTNAAWAAGTSGTVGVSGTAGASGPTGTSPGSTVAAEAAGTVAAAAAELATALLSGLTTDTSLVGVKIGSLLGPEPGQMLTAT
jgi:predicted ATPase/DNA-binding SARP family transcriptional activator